MAIVSYMIGYLFITVYGMAIDAILHCFLLDEELSKTKGRNPSFTPEYLRDFLDKVEAAKKKWIDYKRF